MAKLLATKRGVDGRRFENNTGLARCAQATDAVDSCMAQGDDGLPIGEQCMLLISLAVDAGSLPKLVVQESVDSFAVADSSRFRHDWQNWKSAGTNSL